MSEIVPPDSWQRWMAIAGRALAPGPPVPYDQLLLLTDLAGRNIRPLEPPAGVIARSAAVLILLYPDDSDLRLPLTVRSDTLPNHRGEVSLPGGATEPQDDSPIATALRECQEELGVDPQEIEILGSLSPIYIPPSNFRITPIVGFIPKPPLIRVNLEEVSAVITITLRELMSPDSVVVEQWNRRGIEMLVPFFTVAGYKVWGATALILSEFVARMRRAQNEQSF